MQDFVDVINMHDLKIKNYHLGVIYVYIQANNFLEKSMKNFVFTCTIIICFCLTSSSCLFSADQEGISKKEYLYMDALALEAGTDKSSAFHNYTEVYSQFFSPFKNTPIKFLEIGIYKGDSVKLWEQYFPNAELHFIDISDKMIRYYSSRAHYHFLSQSDPKALARFGKMVGGDFDLIIDDGGHTMSQQIISFKNLFPLLKSGGLYIIEDLHTSYWTTYGGNGDQLNPKAGQGTAVEFLKNLVEDLNYVGAVTSCADFDKAPQNLIQGLNYYQSYIYSIQFFSSVCIIKKR